MGAGQSGPEGRQGAPGPTGPPGVTGSKGDKGDDAPDPCGTSCQGSVATQLASNTSVVGNVAQKFSSNNTLSQFCVGTQCISSDQLQNVITAGGNSDKICIGTTCITSDQLAALTSILPSAQTGSTTDQLCMTAADGTVTCLGSTDVGVLQGTHDFYLYDKGTTKYVGGYGGDALVWGAAMANADGLSIQQK